MKLLITAFSSLVLSMFSFTTLETTTVNIDPDNSIVEWKASKVTGKHNGTVKVEEGSLTFNDDQLQGGSFTIDMTSLQSTDLEGSGKSKLEGHLKSEDFFGVEKFP